MSSLSVIVPIFNAEKYLNTCIESIIKSSFVDFDLFLIDDGSTDGSSAICDQWEEKDIRVHVTHTQNAGPGPARNLGIAQAQSKYITFVDSDDLIHPAMYLRMLECAEKTDAALTMCEIVRFKDGTLPPKLRIQNSFCHASNRDEVIRGLLYPILGAKNGKHYLESSACRCLYRTKILQENMIIFPSDRKFLSEDLLFNIDYLAVCPSAVTLQDKLYFYRVRKDSVSQTPNPERVNALKNMIRYLENRCCELRLDPNECIPRIAYRMLAYSSVFAKEMVRLPFRQACSELKTLASDAIFKQALKNSNYQSYPFQLRLFCQLMRSKCVGIAWILIRLYVFFS